MADDDEDDDIDDSRWCNNRLSLDSGNTFGCVEFPVPEAKNTKLSLDDGVGDVDDDADGDGHAAGAGAGAAEATAKFCCCC